MTAQELINLLKNFPPEHKVVIRGYEDGFNDILELRRIRVIHNSDLPWYYGNML
jgi:hypothetical protein